MPSHQEPLEACCTATCTLASAGPEPFDAVPQKSPAGVEQPASKFAFEYAPPFAGKSIVELASSVRFDHRAAWPISVHSRSASCRENGFAE